MEPSQRGAAPLVRQGRPPPDGPNSFERSYDTHRMVPLSAYAAGRWENAEKKPDSVETSSIPSIANAHRPSFGSSCPHPLRVLEDVCRTRLPAERHREASRDASFHNWAAACMRGRRAARERAFQNYQLTASEGWNVETR